MYNTAVNLSDTDKKLIKVDINTIKLCSFEDVLIKFTPLIKSIVNQWSKFDSEEIYQICSIGLWKAYDAYDLSKDVTFGFYAKKVMLNDVYCYAKKAHKDKTVSLNENPISDNKDTEFLESIHDTSTDVNNMEENIIYNSFLKEYLQILPQIDKQIFSLYYIEEYRQKEIGDMLNFTQPAISYKLNKINNYIKRIYEINEIINYIPNSIRDFIKKAYILDNLDTYLSNSTLDSLILTLNFIKITLKKIQAVTNPIEKLTLRKSTNCIQWLQNTYDNLDSYIKVNEPMNHKNNTKSCKDKASIQINFFIDNTMETIKYNI